MRLLRSYTAHSLIWQQQRRSFVNGCTTSDIIHSPLAWKERERASSYRIAGNFRGVLIFVIFVTIPRVMKFSTHEIFHPRIFSRLLRIYNYIGLRESRNLKPRKLILKTRDSFSRKFAPPKITRYTVCIPAP